MTPDRHARVREVFATARKLSPASRAEFIIRACAGDDEVRAEVESLLAHDSDGDDFLKAPSGFVDFLNAAMAESPQPTPPDDGSDESFAEVHSRSTDIPSTIGRYHILRQLGEGGMGTVFLAEQEQPRRKVAVKVIKSALASAKYRRRFEHEAEVLGRLQHPGIALIHEAGIAEVGFGRLPFFAMEHIDGVPLLEYAQQNKLDLQAKLRLAIQICEAVEHAHQKGIIHRDLKSGNILVTAGGQAKILDFGVAKTMDLDVQATMPHTEAGQIVGTIQYMSPEQATGASDAIDTRSDVYSLGIVFYELISGGLPYDLSKTSLLQALAMIREQPPARFASAGRIEKEVETIILKAIEKDPARRYQSVTALMTDFRHFLAGEPIDAKRDSSWYVLRKSARRYRWPLAAASSFILLLATSTVVAWALYAKAKQANEALAWKSYADCISLAHTAYGESRMRAMREHLAQCPSKFRGWEWRYLNRLSEASDLTLKGQDGPVMSVAFSPDGQWLASGSVGNTVRLWHAASGREIWSGREHKEGVNAVVFGPKGTWLASASSDSTVRIWDTATGKILQTLTSPRTAVSCVAVNFQKKLLALGSGSGHIDIWDADSLRPRQGFPGHTTPVFSLAFSRDGNKLISCSRDDVNIWEISQSGTVEESRPVKLEIRKPKHGQNVGSFVAFCADSSRFFAISPDNTVGVWDSATLERVQAFSGTEHDVMTAADSPDGKWLACADRNGNIGIWDVASSTRMWVLRGHEKYVGALAFSPDGCWLASAGNDGDVRIWHHPLAEDGQDEFAGPLFFSDGKECFVENRAIRARGDMIYNLVRKQATAWDWTTGEQTVLPFVDYAAILAVSPDARLLAYGLTIPIVRSTSIAGGVRVRDAVTNAQLWETPENLPEGVQVLAFSPDGQQLVSNACGRASGDSPSYGLDVWNATTGQRVWQSRGHTKPVQDVAFDPEGKRLASGDEAGNIILWTASSGERLQTMAGHSQQIHRLQFSADGRWLLSASEDQTCRLWDLATGCQICSYVGHSADVNSAAFNAGETRILSAANDGQVRIWEPHHPERALLTLQTQSAGLWATFSPDGDSVIALASGNHEGLIVWSTEKPSRDLVHRRFVAARARRIVDPLYEEFMVPLAVLNKLGSGASEQSEDAEVSAAAIEYANLRASQLYLLELNAWKIVELPPQARNGEDAASEQGRYEKARETMEYVCERTPESVEYLHTLGVARYRSEHYEDALKTLTETTRRRGAEHDLAFLAMTLYKLGRFEEARARLQQAEDQLQGCDASRTPHHVRFIEEAERLIRGADKPATTPAEE